MRKAYLKMNYGIGEKSEYGQSQLLTSFSVKHQAEEDKVSKLRIVTKKEKSILPWPDSHLLCLVTPSVHSKSPGTLFALGKKCQIVYINRALKLCMKDFQFSQHRQMYLYKSGHHVENKILHLYQ